MTTKLFTCGSSRLRSKDANELESRAKGSISLETWRQIEEFLFVFPSITITSNVNTGWHGLNR